jgi:S-adenosylmethionine hydrolase
MRPICFLSDFGLADDFVGTCKGVILKIAPGASIVDLTHDVSDFEVAAGAEMLDHATRYMPDDAVYLAIVDPGVGTKRRELAIRTRSNALLVGPDNGLLIPASDSLGGISEAVALTNGDYQIHPVSNTFHGRDIFAPAAAHLASGVEIQELGETVDAGSLIRFSPPIVESSQDGKSLRANIIAIDRFGNARLSVMQEDSGFEFGDVLRVDAGDGGMSVRYVDTFGAANPGELILVPDSHWRLSLSVNKGNAAQALSLKVGATVLLSKTQEP